MLFILLACDPVAVPDVQHESALPVSTSPDDSVAPGPVVYVNELSSGDDWVELYSEEASVSLEGLTLSDDYLEPDRQTLSGTLEGYLVVDLVVFRLASEGEAVGIFDGSEPLDWVVFPALQADEVYARLPDGGEDWTTMVRGTPGESNRLVEIEEIAAVPAGSEWSYLDGGEDPEEGWDLPGFDAESWSSGPAPLGYGDSQTTVVSYGDDANDKHPTTWFRHSFEHTGSAISAQLGLVCDDGCLVRLNGEEVLRWGLPDGDLSSDTYADVTASGSAETEWHTRTVDPTLLLEGENVLSGEVHQVQASSSDITFDASLDLVVER